MIPILQSRRNGTGNCMQACIASLLELRLEEVPDFTGRPDAFEPHETGYEIWWLDIQQWLAGKGLFFLEVQLSMKTWMPLPFEALAIFIGERMTENDTHYCRHAIVGKCEGDRFFPMHDPLGGEPTQALHNAKIHAVCFLVPLDSGLLLRMGKALDHGVRLARQLPGSPIRDAILLESEQALGISGAHILPFTRNLKSNGKG